MEQHITTIVAACSFVAACLSAYFANRSAKAAGVANRLELIRRRFDVFTTVVSLHARLYVWDQPGEAREMTPEVESAFLNFSVARAQADVLFPKSAPVHSMINRIGDDANRIAIDRREPHQMKEYMKMATVEDQMRLANEKMERNSRFYLSSLPELREALRPYVTYELLEQ